MSNLESLHTQINAALQEGINLCFLVRDSDLQRAHTEKLAVLRKEASQVKSICREEDAANLELALEYALDAQLYELKMWLALKDNAAGSAWSYLVDAQSATRWAICAHEAAEKLSINQDRLLLIEKLVFPPQLFLSVGIVVKEAICTICGSIYGECDHIVGRPYKGQMCSKRITKSEAREVSLVDEPANKHCRILIIEEKGVKRDYLTWRPITDDAGKDNEPI